jgi:acyl-CoA synthetase (AMP-forming)/AMP-acid ligase II
VWSDVAAGVPDREAIVCGDRRVTWHDFDDRASRLASHLHDTGLRPGDKVAIALTNTPEYLETFFGALLLGCAPVNVNYRYVADEMHYVLDDSDAKTVVHSPALAENVTKAAERIPAQSRPRLLETGAGGSYEAALAGAGRDGDWRARPPDGDDLILLYTGGTTGMPKGVMWRNDDLYVSLWQMTRPGTEPPDPVAAAAAGKRAREPSSSTTGPVSTRPASGPPSSARTCRCSRSWAMPSRGRCSPRSRPNPTAGTSRTCARSRRRA